MGLYTEPERKDFWQLYPGSPPYDDQWGPLDCQPHSLSRAIMRHYEGIRPAGIAGLWPPTGEYIRSVTRERADDGSYTGPLDRTAGTNLGQMEAVAAKFYKMDLEVHYGLPWATFENNLASSKGATLSVYYDPIRTSTYLGSTTFKGNHQIFVSGIDRTRKVLTGVIDPLADGRRSGLFKGPADYPIELLKRAAGLLDVRAKASHPYRPLGHGLCFVGFTKPTGLAPSPPLTWRVSIEPRATIRIYSLSSTGCIQAGWEDFQWGSTSSSAPCTAPVSRKTCDGASSATTVRITAGAFAGKTVRAFGSGVTARQS